MPAPPSGFPEPLVRFVELFNREEFWESHEALEMAWRESRSGFYHGLILYASAFVHLQRRNARGVEAQLSKAERTLLPYEPHYLGVDVTRILLLACGLRREVEEASSHAWAESFEFPRLQLDPERLSGNEPELKGSDQS